MPARSEHPVVLKLLESGDEIRCPRVRRVATYGRFCQSQVNVDEKVFIKKPRRKERDGNQKYGAIVFRRV